MINKTNLDTVFLGLSTAFHRAWETTPTQWDKLAMRVPSSTGREEYKWLSEFPRMREWVGDKTLRSLAAHDYTVRNRDFESTVEIDRNDIEDDSLGIYGPQAQMAGYSAKRFPDELIFDLLASGFGQKCYDGKSFFASDHPVGGKTASNKGTAALDTSTLSKAQASFGAARTALRKLVDEDGRPLGVMPGLLVVPPALDDTARAMMTVERLEDGKANIYRGAAEVLMSPHLTSDTAWFLLDVSRPVRPLLYQERKAPDFVQQTEMDSDSVFLRRKYRYGVECRGAAGYGLWQMAYGSTGE